MIAVAFMVALEVCPVGAVVDHVDEHAVVVLGSSGVRVVARETVRSARPHGLREGDRVAGWSRGRCEFRAPTTSERDRIRAQLGRLLARPSVQLPLPIAEHAPPRASPR